MLKLVGGQVSGKNRELTRRRGFQDDLDRREEEPYIARMSIWIRSMHRQPVTFTADELLAGIGERLTLLTCLYCPPDEEPVGDVLARLSLDLLAPGVWALRYRPCDPFIRVELWHGPAARAEASELRDSISSLAGPAVKVRALLDVVTEAFGFELKSSHAEGMGWPIAIAAAAWLAKRGDGLIYAESEGWMAPTPSEIRPVLGMR